MSTLVLKPGFLVSLSTRLEGGVQYQRVDLEIRTSMGDTAVEKWETTKVTEDPEEYARAVKVRGKVSSLIRGACIPSNFGVMLCPIANEKLLDEAIEEAHQIKDAFNASARSTHLSLYTMRGRIAESEGEAARAIAAELRSMIDTMKEGIDEADVEKIRKAASDAKKMGRMLDAPTANKVQAAVEEARTAAREITKKILAGADKASIEIEKVNLKALEEARFAFLDFDAPSDIAPLPVPTRAVEVDDDDGEGEGGASMADADDKDERAAMAAYTAPKLEV